VRGKQSKRKGVRRGPAKKTAAASAAAPAAPASDEILLTEDLQSELGLSEHQVRVLLRSGVLKCRRVGQHHQFQVLRSDLDRFKRTVVRLEEENWLRLPWGKTWSGLPPGNTLAKRDPEELLPVWEVAEELGVARQSVLQVTALGLMPAVKRRRPDEDGRIARVWVRSGEIEKFVKRLTKLRDAGWFRLPTATGGWSRRIFKWEGARG
jgi:hypothetical protein